jgi:hypothetical protein
MIARTFLDIQLYYCYADKKFYIDESECKGKKYIEAPFIDSVSLKQDFIEGLEHTYKNLFWEVCETYKKLSIDEGDPRAFFVGAFDEFIEGNKDLEKRWYRYEDRKIREIIFDWRKANNAW